jgi:hypothetical protein
MGIHDILVTIRIQILGSVPLTNTSGCGSGRPKKHTNPEPETGTLVNLHHSSKIKSQKKLQNSRNQDVSHYFCLMMERSVSGSVLVTNGSGSVTTTLAVMHTV